MTDPEQPNAWRLEAVLAATLILGPAIAVAIAADHLTGGEVAGWIEALSTLGAFVAAVFAARYAKGAFEFEQRREQELEEEHRAAQAAQVSAWVGVKTYYRETDEPYFEDLYGIYFRNASELPVSQVRASVGSTPDGIEQIAVLPPTPEPYYLTLNLEVVRALEIHEGNMPTLTLTFTDASGHRWVRDGAAPLRRLQ